MLVIFTVLKCFYKFAFALSFSTRTNFLKWIFFSRWHNYLSVTFFQTTYNLALKQPELCIFNKSMNPGSFKLLFYYILQVKLLAGNAVVVKKLHPSLSEDVVKSFAKEAKLLYHINYPNFLLLLGVCKNPMALIMDFPEFSFAPFGNDLISHSLDVFPKIFNGSDFVSSFPNLFNFVAFSLV